MNYSQIIHKIILPEHLREQLLKKTSHNIELEVAGLLLGETKNHISHCSSILYGNEAEWKRDSFKISDPKLIKYFTKNGAHSSRIIGIFHAHPDGDLFPSLEDIKGMIITDVPWLIFKVRNKKILIKAFLYEEEVIRKIKII